MLFADSQDRVLPRVAAVGALVGMARGLKQLWDAHPAELLEVERYTGHAPGGDYAHLGFSPPAGGIPRLGAH